MPRKLTKQQVLINKLVTVEFSKDKYFWGRETKIINNLIEKYSFEFLDWVKPPHNYKVTSLVYFLTGAGQKYLSEQLFEFQRENMDLSPVSSIIELEDEKIGEDILIKKKPNTLQEFLN